MIRKFLYIMVILFAMSNIAFADTKNVTITKANSANQFVADTYITAKDGFNCQPLKEKYKKEYETEIIGYDLMKGIVKCVIIPKQANVLEIPRTENANRLSTQETFEEYYKNYNKSTLEKLLTFDVNRMTDLFIEDSATQIEVNKGETLSSYLSGLAVLNGMDAEKTAGMKESKTISANLTDIFRSNKLDDKTITETTNVAKNLNQNNIEYFENLFTNMNTVYIHLQNLLFIVMGGFFLATLGGGKIQKYLENRGQSTGNKEPYLHKFFIPLLCAGVFYMPITSGGGVNFTL